jgi:homoserine dehydrogenase
LVPLILLTQPVREQAMNAAILSIEALPAVTEKVVRIRVERLDS